MLVTTASVVADRGRLDEDFVGAVPGAAVVVDGAFLPGAEGVCRHGVAWYARRLGGTLIGELGHGDDRGLAALLASSIERVTDEHRPTGDTAHPWSPWAAVAAVRVQAGRVAHLVLGDATVLLERVDGPPLAATDRREVDISESYLPALAAARDEEERSRVLAALRARRNSVDGFWVAKDDPSAAAEAVTGATPVVDVRTLGFPVRDRLGRLRCG